MIPAALATYTVDAVTPDAPEEAKLAESAALASAGTKFISPLMGAGAAAMSETLLPMYASFQAADKVAQAVHTALPNDLGDLPSSVIEGAASGGAGGAAFAATATAQAAAVQAASSAYAAATTTAATAEGIEFAAASTVPLLEAAEVTLFTAAAEGAAAGSTVGRTVGAAGGIPGMLAGAAGGAVLGAGLGLYSYFSKERKDIVTPSISAEELARRDAIERIHAQEALSRVPRTQEQEQSNLLTYLSQERLGTLSYKDLQTLRLYRQQREAGNLPSHLQEAIMMDEGQFQTDAVRQQSEQFQLYDELRHYGDGISAYSREEIQQLRTMRQQGTLPQHLEEIFQQFDPPSMESNAE